MPTRDIVEKNKKELPPGSEQAEIEGCTCSKVDNCGGKGYLGHRGTWAISVGCPLHFCEPLHKVKKRKEEE